MIAIIVFISIGIAVFAGASNTITTCTGILSGAIYYYFTMYGYKNGEYTLNDYIEETIIFKFRSKVSKEEYNSLLGAGMFYSNDVKEMFDKSNFKKQYDYNQCLYVVMETQKAMNKHISYFYGVRYKETHLRYTMYSYDFYNLLIKILCPPLEKEYWKRMGVEKDRIVDIDLSPFMQTLILTAYENEYISQQEKYQLLKYYHLQ